MFLIKKKASQHKYAEFACLIEPGVTLGVVEASANSWRLGFFEAGSVRRNTVKIIEKL